MSAWEALNIQIGAVVGGTHFGSLAGMGSSGSSGGVQLWASAGLRSKRSRQQQRAALSVAPGHVAATPAGPVEDEPMQAGGSASSSRGSSMAGSVCSEPHADRPAEACLHSGRPANTGQAQTAAHAGEQQAAVLMPALEQQPSVAAGCVGSSGSREAGGGSSKRGSTWDSPSEVPCSPQPGWANLGAASAAGEAAAAAAADFMHPAHWAAARQAAAAAAVTVAGGAADAAPAHSTSSSSVAGSSSSLHSFLLPGACYSSSQTSSEAGELAAFAAGFTAGETFSGAAGGSSAAEQQHRQSGVVLTAATLAAAEQPVSEVEAATAAAAADAAAEAAAAAPAGGQALDGAEGEQDAALPLYGRGDHLLQAARPLTVAERLQLVLRAGELVYLFAPFLLLGCFMLLLASQLEAAATRRRSKQRQRAEAQHQAPAAAAAAAPAAVQATDALGQQQQEGDEDETAVVASPAAQRLKTAAWRLLLRACKRAGAATVKWAQWSSTREDVFPEVGVLAGVRFSAAYECSSGHIPCRAPALLGVA